MRISDSVSVYNAHKSKTNWKTSASNQPTYKKSGMSVFTKHNAFSLQNFDPFTQSTLSCQEKIIFLHRECSYLLLMSTLGPLRLTLTALSPGRILMIPTHICWLNSVEHYTRLTICTPQGLPKLEYRSIFWEKEYMEPQAIKDTAQIDFLWSVSWPMAVRIWLCCEKIVNLNCSGQVLPTCLGGELPRGRS